MAYNHKISRLDSDADRGGYGLANGQKPILCPDCHYYHLDYILSPLAGAKKVFEAIGLPPDLP